MMSDLKEGACFDCDWTGSLDECTREPMADIYLCPDCGQLVEPIEKEET